MAGDRLAGKSCLITGAAGGIGAAIARRLIDEGAKVVLTDLELGPIEKLAEELGSDSASAVVADVVVEDQMRSAVGHAVQRFGSLDVLFNNAGIPLFSPLEAIERVDFDRVMGINVYGVLMGCKVAAEQMSGQDQGGKIVNTCSVVGKRGGAQGTIYTASKFAVRGITQSLAQELAGDGITVNSFCPGIVTTALWDELGEAVVTAGLFEKGDELQQTLAESAVLGRASAPNDVAGLAAFLASADSDYMTGQCVNVDGGMVFD